MSDGISGKASRAQPGARLSRGAGKAASPGDGGDRRAQLIRTIEGEIVPRLLVSLSRSLTAASDAPDPDAIAALAQLLLRRENPAGADIVRMVCAPEARLDRKCLGLIAPAARRLGELWERGGCDIDQLIVGLGLLESMIREAIARGP